MASDLKETVERLNQNPFNSSRSSGSPSPWDKGVADGGGDKSTCDEKEVLRSETGIGKEEPSDTAGATEKDNYQSKESTE